MLRHIASHFVGGGAVAAGACASCVAGACVAGACVAAAGAGSSSTSAAAAAAAVSIKQPQRDVLDMYGNTWSLHGGRLIVRAAGGRAPAAVALPAPLDGGPNIIIATDENGYVWAGGKGSALLFRLNPRGPGYTGASAPAVFIGQQRFCADTAAHRLWQPFALPQGLALENLASSTSGFCAIATLSNGSQVDVSISPDGTSLATPITADGTQARPFWRAAKARLPCGNHDITAAESGGRIFISGGAMHFRGFPATHHEFDEVWSIEPAELDSSRNAWVVETRMPVSPPQGVSAREYNGLVAVGESELWVIGGSVSASQPAVSRPDDRVPMRSCHAYNVTTQEWRELPSLLHARDAATAEFVAGRVWCVGGVGVTAVESIAPGETSWRYECEVPAGFDVYSPACCLGGKIFFFGSGGDHPKKNGVGHGLVSFDPTSGKWDETIPPPPGLGFPCSAPAVATHRGKVWVMGGTGGSERNNLKTWSFDPANYSWGAGPDLPASVAWGASWSVSIGAEQSKSLVAIAGGRWDDAQQTHVFEARTFVLEE